MDPDRKITGRFSGDKRAIEDLMYKVLVFLSSFLKRLYINVRCE